VGSQVRLKLRLAALVLIGGCAFSSGSQFQVTVFESDGYAFPTFSRSENGAGPLALFEGDLVESSGCLWLQDGVSRGVILWPDSFSLIDVDGPKVMGDDQVFRLGDRVTTNGGSWDRSAFNVTGLEILSDKCANAAWVIALGPVLASE
jgi:hypothetical protein